MSAPLARLRSHAAAQLAASRKAIQDFAGKLVLDPSHLLRWSDLAFAAAANIERYAYLEAVIGRLLEGEMKFNGVPVSPLEVLRILKKSHDDIAQRSARFPYRGTSPAGGQLEQELARAAAEIAELIGHELVTAEELAR